MQILEYGFTSELHEGYREGMEREHEDGFWHSHHHGEEWHFHEEHNRQLERWKYTCNYVRPQQALYYLTPAEYHKLWLESQRPKRH